MADDAGYGKTGVRERQIAGLGLERETLGTSRASFFFFICKLQRVARLYIWGELLIAFDLGKSWYLSMQEIGWREGLPYLVVMEGLDNE